MDILEYWDWLIEEGRIEFEVTGAEVVGSDNISIMFDIVEWDGNFWANGSIEFRYSYTDGIEFEGCTYYIDVDEYEGSGSKGLQEKIEKYVLSHIDTEKIPDLMLAYYSLKVEGDR